MKKSKIIKRDERRPWRNEVLAAKPKPPKPPKKSVPIKGQLDFLGHDESENEKPEK